MDLGETHGGLPPDSVVEDLDAILASTQAVHARLHDGDRISVTVAPCSPFSVTTRPDDGSRPRWPATSALRLHTHLAETLDEERDSLARFGRRPLELLDDLGWIAPTSGWRTASTSPTRRSPGSARAGTGVAHCPSSNCRLGSGIARVADLVAAGVPGRAGRRRRRLQRDRRPAARAAPGDSTWPASARSRPTAFGPADALALATTGGAACLGRDGHRRAGGRARADVVVWPGDDLADVLDPLAGLVLGPERSARHVLVDGEYVVRDGALVGLDLADLRRRPGPPGPSPLAQLTPGGQGRGTSRRRRRRPAPRRRATSSREPTGAAPAATTSAYRSDGTS